VRSDTKRNRKYLVKAAAKLFAETDGPVSMTEVAREAEVSPATAYRHFSSVAEILTEFRHGVGEALYEFSNKQRTTGVQLLKDVSSEWIRLVIKHGSAMVHTRSSEGYLQRLRGGTEYLTVQARALERPIREATAERGLPDLGDQAMFFWNILFDPREIFDLLETLKLTRQEVADRLVEGFLGALRGWVGESQAENHR
jgi:AcrR family transcriptional regulator